jgi:hypothetical protein
MGAAARQKAAAAIKDGLANFAVHQSVEVKQAQPAALATGSAANRIHVTVQRAGLVKIVVECSVTSSAMAMAHVKALPSALAVQDSLENTV